MELDPSEQAALEAQKQARLAPEALGSAIYTAMEVLLSPGTVVEVRIPKAILDPSVPDKTSVVLGWFDNPQSIADEIACWPYTAEGIYYTINPINPIFISKTKNRLARGKKAVTDEDIVRRTTVLIDIDAIRPGGVSATETQKKCAKMVRNNIVRYLTDLRWPPAVLVDSGNGYHILYRIDLPTNDNNLVKNILMALDQKFTNNTAKVDTTVYNPSRIAKVPGTYACKGEDDPLHGRPHRASKMLFHPKSWDPVPLDLLQLLADQCSQEDTPPGSNALVSQTSWGPPVTMDRSSVIEDARAKIMEMPPSIAGEHGHDKLWAVTMTLMDGFGLPRTEAAILLKEYNARSDCDPETDTALQHKLDDAEKEIDKRGGPSFSCIFVQDPRVPILVDTELHTIRDNILSVLPLDLSLYTRGEFLVSFSQIESDKTSTYTSNARGTYVIGPIGEAAFTCKLVEHAYFYYERVSPKGEVIKIPCNPPSIPIKAVLEARYHKGVRHLSSIVEAPYLDNDGGLISTGYNNANGTIYIETVPIPALPEAPSQADAQSAAQRLLDLVCEFPFASQNDKITWLSGVITAVARPMIRGPAPGLAIIGNKAAVGKGKLVHIASIIATGRPCPATSYPTDKPEARKVKTTFAMDGTSMVLLDDLDDGASYGNGPLDSVITENIINERILGGNRSTGPIELRPTWFLTGNNIVPGRDAYRRWLVCSLVSDLASPEERQVAERNLSEKAQANRGALLRDVLIILKAHHNAGFPDGGWAPLGSFEEWDRIVRASVWYATGLDCNTTRKTLASESPELLRKRSLLSALHLIQDQFIDGTHPFRSGFTVNTILELAGETRGQPYFKRKYPDLVAALCQYGKNDTIPSAQSLGTILAKLNNVVLEGMNGWRLQKVGVVSHSVKWCVVPGPTGAVSSGSGGTEVVPRATGPAGAGSSGSDEMEGSSAGSTTPRPGATGRTGAVSSGSGGREG